MASPQEETEVRVEVESIVVHPGYNSPTLHENDIALIKVKSGGGELCTRGKVRAVKSRCLNSD